MKRSGKKREFVVPDAQRWQTRKKQAAEPKVEARAPIVRYELHEFPEAERAPLTRRRGISMSYSRGGTVLRKFENGREVSVDLDSRDVEEVVAELRAAGFTVEEIVAGSVMGPRR